MNHAYNMDCLEAMRQMPDKCFSLAVVDPPYFDGPNKRGYYGSKQNKYHTPRVVYPKTDTWEVPGQEYFHQLLRVSRHQIVWGCNYYDYPFGPGRIVWDKCNGASSFSDCEIAFCSLHDSVRLFRYMWNGMFQGKSAAEGHIMQGDKTRNERRIHPTQKPVALYSWLYSRYAKPGDKILDTHLGSGSSRLAAWDAGLEPEEVAELRSAAELERRVGSAVGDGLDRIIRSAEAVLAHTEDSEALQVYRALGTVEELSVLVKARDEGRVLPDGSGWFVTSNGKKLTVIMDINAVREAEAAIGGGGDG